MESHPEEEGILLFLLYILHTYISKYCDFRELINDAVSTLQKLDDERPQIETQLQRRQLQFEPYTESEANSQQFSEPLSTFPIPQLTAVSSVQVHTPIQHVEPSNLPFVDASTLCYLCELFSSRRNSQESFRRSCHNEAYSLHSSSLSSTLRQKWTKPFLSLLSNVRPCTSVTTYEDGSKEYALGAILLNKLPRRI
ncbi:hypothetical protein RB195_007223 [Necator americanus]